MRRIAPNRAGAPSAERRRTAPNCAELRGIHSSEEDLVLLEEFGKEGAAADQQRGGPRRLHHLVVDHPDDALFRPRSEGGGAEHALQPDQQREHGARALQRRAVGRTVDVELVRRDAQRLLGELAHGVGDDHHVARVALVELVVVVLALVELVAHLEIFISGFDARSRSRRRLRQRRRRSSAVMVEKQVEAEQEADAEAELRLLPRERHRAIFPERRCSGYRRGLGWEKSGLRAARYAVKIGKTPAIMGTPKYGRRVSLMAR